MTIHQDHPFADPEPDPVRRLRGRVGATVSLWTAGPADDAGAWAGLTVSSYAVVAGEPGRVVGMVDPDSDLAAGVERSGRAVVQLLAWEHRALADAFAGQRPAPGGPFRLGTFTGTPYGPKLADATCWAMLRLESARPLGWSRELVLVVDDIEIGPDPDAAQDRPLVHRRGRYAR